VCVRNLVIKGEDEELRACLVI
jgi:hypothetical protein